MMMIMKMSVKVLIARMKTQIVTMMTIMTMIVKTWMIKMMIMTMIVICEGLEGGDSR